MADKIPMTKENVRSALAQHDALLAQFLKQANRGGVTQGLDKIRRAATLCTDALAMLDRGSMAAAILALGQVQGVIYGLGLQTWEMISRTTER